MASVTAGQRSNIKRIVEECFKLDTTFRDNEGGQSNPAFSQMPIETIIAEVHKIVHDLRKANNYRYAKEYFWFTQYYEEKISWPTLAEWFGYTTGVPIEVRVDEFEDEVVYSMSEGLATKCWALYKEFFIENKLPDPPKAPQIREKRGAYKHKISILTNLSQYAKVNSVGYRSCP